MAPELVVLCIMPLFLNQSDFFLGIPKDVLRDILSRYLPPKAVFYTSKSCKHAQQFFKFKSAKNAITSNLIQKQKKGAFFLVSGRTSTLFSTYSYSKPLLYIAGKYLKQQVEIKDRLYLQNPLLPMCLPKDLHIIDSIQTNSLCHDFYILSGCDKQGQAILAVCGNNTFGQLGTEDHKERKEFTRITLPYKLISIDFIKTGLSITFVAGKDKSGNAVVAVAGNNISGHLGTGDTRGRSILTPINLPKGMVHVDLIETSTNHTVIKGRDTSGKTIVAAAGCNIKGQLGTGDSKRKHTLTVVNLPDKMLSVVSIALEANHTVIAGKDKAGNPIIAVAGENSSGTLGTGDYKKKNHFTSINLPEGMKSVLSVAIKREQMIVTSNDVNGRPMIAVSGGGRYSCLETENKSKNKLIPMILPKELHTIESIEFGFFHALLLGRDKDRNPIVASAGQNKYGQLGLGHTNNQKKRFTYIRLPDGMVEVDSIRANQNQSFIVGHDKKGTIMVAPFGDNKNNKLGLSKDRFIKLPTVIPRPKTPYTKEETFPDRATITP